MREKSCIIRSKRLLEEMYVFIWKNARPEAAPGYNDDLIMSFCQGLWVRDTALKLRQAGIMINKMALSNIKATASVYKSTSQSNPWKLNTPHGNQEDMNWLL